MNDSDEANLERLLALFDGYAPVIRGLLMRIVGDEEGAEDLLADTFATGWAKIQRLDVEPLPVLVEIARKNGLEWVRAKGTPVSPEESKLQRSFVISSPLGKLLMLQRRAVEHVFFEGGSVSSFAHKVKAPREWVSAALANAMLILWENYKKEFIEFLAANEACGGGAAQNFHDFIDEAFPLKVINAEKFERFAVIACF